jgi:hypothetical protein
MRHNMDFKYIKEKATMLGLTNESQMEYLNFLFDEIEKEAYKRGYDDGYADGLNNSQQ